MELMPPVTKQYNYEALAHAVSVWWSIEKSEPWVAKGYSSCAPGHKNAVSSRQWDSASSVLDDELEKNTADIIGSCMDRLEHVERALVTCGLCGHRITRSTPLWCAALQLLQASGVTFSRSHPYFLQMPPQDEH